MTRDNMRDWIIQTVSEKIHIATGLLVEILNLGLVMVQKKGILST